MMARHMDTYQAIAERRSVKHYDSHHVMPEEDLSKLMDLALLSPTSFNIQNWRFVAVTDQTIQDEMKAASWGQAQVSDASLVVLLCADLKAHSKDPDRYWKNAPEAVQQMLVPMIGKFYDNNEALQRDEALRSIGIASQTLMLAAKAMGYDSCPMIGFDPQKIGEIIKLPEDHMIGMMITIGKALQPANERGGQLDKSEVVFRNHF
jgi:nitroreductase